MATVSVPNPTTEEPVPTPPVKPDGSAYRYEMIHDDIRTWADTPTELATAILPEYAALGAEARARARLAMAIGVQVRLQAALVLDGDLTACRPEERDVLLGTRTQPPSIGQWEAPIPLVLVASYYQPYTSQPGPTVADPGEVIWLDPTTDHALITSLAQAGVIGLAEHPSPEDPDTSQANEQPDGYADQGRDG